MPPQPPRIPLASRRKHHPKEGKARLRFERSPPLPLSPSSTDTAVVSSGWRLKKIVQAEPSHGQTAAYT